MATGRYFHSLVKLNDGRVMALGGSTAVNASGTAFDAAIAIVNSATSSAEIYNPATGLWSNAQAMPWKRTGVAAAVLPNGKVLVSTGAGPDPILGIIPSFFRTTALYTPGTNSWQSITQVPGNNRALPTVSKLANGQIMLSGGCQGNVSTLTLNSLTDVHIFDPATENWAPAPYHPLPFGRTGHSATLLTNGALVVSGGASGDVLFPTVTTDVSAYDGFTWTSIGSLNHERAFHYAALTEDAQRIFLYGGIESGGISALIPTCELFGP
jgi:N-acetylneuraminic acid mutarotase